ARAYIRVSPVELVSAQNFHRFETGPAQRPMLDSTAGWTPTHQEGPHRASPVARRCPHQRGQRPALRFSPPGERPPGGLDSPWAGRACSSWQYPARPRWCSLPRIAAWLRVASRWRVVLSRSPLRPWLSSLLSRTSKGAPTEDESHVEATGDILLW